MPKEPFGLLLDVESLVEENLLCRSGAEVLGFGTAVNENPQNASSPRHALR